MYDILIKKTKTKEELSFQWKCYNMLEIKLKEKEKVVIDIGEKLIKEYTAGIIFRIDTINSNRTYKLKINSYSIGVIT